MANKNQKQIRAKLTRKGADGFAEQVPTHGYHNNEHGAFAPRRIAAVHTGEYKPKTINGKPSKFPKVCAESDEMPLSRQREIFYGVR
jgi:hypothetical protein